MCPTLTEQISPCEGTLSDFYTRVKHGSYSQTANWGLRRVRSTF